jgi:tRNA (guanine37-N1)-methyltransferase
MNEKTTIGICVPLKQAENMHKFLLKNNLLRNDLKIKKDKEYIYFPVRSIPKNLVSYKIDTEFEKRKTKPKSYKEIVSIPDNLKHELPTSYDVVGDIILLKLPKNLMKYQHEIGESLLKSNTNIRTVCVIEPVSGEFRTRNIKVIAGVKQTKTTHKEYGLVLDIDMKKSYFSSRLATERKRIATLVKPNEIVVDMFAGVAPFSIMIAKYANPKIIYALDKNQDAIAFAQQNIKRNNVLDKIELIHADARELHTRVHKKADRIIMNLPFSAYLFFSSALKIAKDQSIIHYYDILHTNRIEERINKLKKIAEESEYTLSNIDVKKIKTYAPREFYIGMDITAKKMPM